MSWFGRKGHFTIVDDATGVLLASSMMQLGDLPDAFKSNMKRHLGDAVWSVIHAEPVTKAVPSVPNGSETTSFAASPVSLPSGWVG